MHHALRNTSQTVAVRASLAGTGARDLLRARLAVGDDGERGSQAAEYAMVGGVGAAACAGLVTILKDGEVLKKIVTALVKTVVTLIGEWF